MCVMKASSLYNYLLYSQFLGEDLEHSRWSRKVNWKVSQISSGTEASSLGEIPGAYWLLLLVW